MYLRRFFPSDKQGNMIFLVDEAHNLVERAREMYSAALIKEVNDYVMDSAALLPVFYKTTPYAYASGLTGNFDLNFYYIYNFGWNA